MVENSDVNEYHPELLSRRGELTAWGLASVCLVAILILLVGGYQVHIALPILALLLILAGIGISLSNWMDRHSVIRIYPESIEFHNGLRNVQLTWDEIQRVEVFDHNWGDKVYVIGERSRFAFRTLGEVRVSGETKGVMGFAGGRRILKVILESSGLKEIDHSENSYYYARE